MHAPSRSRRVFEKKIPKSSVPVFLTTVPFTYYGKCQMRFRWIVSYGARVNTNRFDSSDRARFCDVVVVVIVVVSLFPPFDLPERGFIEEPLKAIGRAMVFHFDRRKVTGLVLHVGVSRVRQHRLGVPVVLTGCHLSIHGSYLFSERISMVRRSLIRHQDRRSRATH